MPRKKSHIPDNSFGGRLRKFRESGSYSITEFAKLLDISHGSLSAVENNKTVTSANTIGHLLQKTDINVRWLYTGQGEMVRTSEERGNPAYLVGDADPGGDPEVSKLLSMTNDVLKSDTDYADSLSANIRSFHHSLELEEQLYNHEKRLAKIESINKAVAALDSRKQIDELKSEIAELKKALAEKERRWKANDLET